MADLLFLVHFKCNELPALEVEDHDVGNEDDNTNIAAEGAPTSNDVGEEHAMDIDGEGEKDATGDEDPVATAETGESIGRNDLGEENSTGDNFTCPIPEIIR